MVAAAQQRSPRRRAQRCGVKPRVLQAAGGELLEVRRLTRATERRRGAEPGVVDPDDQYIRCGGRRKDRPDRRILRVRVFGVKRREADWGDIRYRQYAALDRVFRLGHGVLSVGVTCSLFRGGGRPVGIGRPHRDQRVLLRALFKLRHHLQHGTDDPRVEGWLVLVLLWVRLQIEEERNGSYVEAPATKLPPRG